MLETRLTHKSHIYFRETNVRVKQNIHTYKYVYILQLTIMICNDVCREKFRYIAREVNNSICDGDHTQISLSKVGR